MVLPLIMAGAGLAAAGTVGNRFFQDFANDRARQRQGDQLGGILDQSMMNGELNNDAFASNLMRGGFADQGFGVFGQEQQNDHRLGQMAQQNAYAMQQIGARSAASQALAETNHRNAMQIEEMRQAAAEAVAQPSRFNLTASQALEYADEVEAQSARLAAGAGLEYLVEMMTSEEGKDVYGGRAGQMEILAVNAIPVMQDVLNSGTLNEGEAEFFQELTGSVSGFASHFQNENMFNQQLAKIRGIIASNKARTKAWDQSTGQIIYTANGPDGAPFPMPVQSWTAPTANAYNSNGVPLTEEDRSGRNPGTGRGNGGIR